MIKNKVLHTLLALLLLFVALLPNGVLADNVKGVGSCSGEEACDYLENSEISDYGCVGKHACYKLVYSKVGVYGCTGEEACTGLIYYERPATNLIVGQHACDGYEACYAADNINIGDKSCVGNSVCLYGGPGLTVGQQACLGGQACAYAEDIDIGSNSCDGLFSCWKADNSIIDSNSCVGDYSCTGLYDYPNDYTENNKIGNDSCVKTGSSSQTSGVCQVIKDMVIGSNSCRGDRGTCYISINSTIGDGSCHENDGEAESCYSLVNAEIGNGSCLDQHSCKYIGPRCVGLNYEACRTSHLWKVGNGSCNNEASCYNAGQGDLYDAQVEPQGVDIGDNSCNAKEVCRDCEAGSVVPDNTCNYIPKDVILMEDEDPEVGMLNNDINTPRCRACFVELRNSCQGESACSGATTGTIGYDSCNDEGACEGAVGATIGDNSCNDIEVCKDCEAGSVVPPNTCNYIPNDVILIEDEDPEVGLLDNDINKPRCRACFAELRQGRTLSPTDAPSPSGGPSPPPTEEYTFIGDGYCGNQAYQLFSRVTLSTVSPSIPDPSVCATTCESCVEGYLSHYKGINFKANDSNGCMCLVDGLDSLDAIVAQCPSSSSMITRTTGMIELAYYDFDFDTMDYTDGIGYTCYRYEGQGQDDYSVEIAASTSSRRRLNLAADSGEGSCNELALVVNDHVVNTIRSHPKFVQFLEKRDIPRKCARKFQSYVMGTSNLFGNGVCDVSIKLNAKMALNGAEGHALAEMLENVIDLPAGVALKDVMATKMNCKDGGKRGKGDKAAKKSSKAGGKPGKK